MGTSSVQHTLIHIRVGAEGSVPLCCMTNTTPNIFSFRWKSMKHTRLVWVQRMFSIMRQSQVSSKVDDQIFLFIMLQTKYLFQRFPLLWLTFLFIVFSYWIIYRINCILELFIEFVNAVPPYNRSGYIVMICRTIQNIHSYVLAFWPLKTFCVHQIWIFLYETKEEH